MTPPSTTIRKAKAADEEDAAEAGEEVFERMIRGLCSESMVSMIRDLSSPFRRPTLSVRGKEAVPLDFGSLQLEGQRP